MQKLNLLASLKARYRRDRDNGTGLTIDALREEPKTIGFVEIVGCADHVAKTELAALLAGFGRVCIGWEPEEDEIELGEGPLRCWLDSNDARGFVLAGVIAPEQEAAMREHLLAAQQHYRHGGLAGRTYPLMVQPGGHYSFVAELLDAA